jgi:hypothetical protein
MAFIVTGGRPSMSNNRAKRYRDADNACEFRAC